MNLFALWGLRHLIVECYKWSSDVAHFERSLCLAFSLHAVLCRGMLLAAVKQVGSSIWGSGVLGFWKRPEQGSLSPAHTVQAGTQSSCCYGDRCLSKVDQSHRQNLSWGPGTLLSRKYAGSWAELLFSSSAVSGWFTRKFPNIHQIPYLLCPRPGRPQRLGNHSVCPQCGHIYSSLPQSAGLMVTTVSVCQEPH